MYFGKAAKFWGNCTGGIHFPENTVTESTLVFNAPSVCASSFLSLVVGYLMMILQVLESASKCRALSV